MHLPNHGPPTCNSQPSYLANITAIVEAIELQRNCADGNVSRAGLHRQCANLTVPAVLPRAEDETTRRDDYHILCDLLNLGIRDNGGETQGCRHGSHRHGRAC